jgi:hypothetical protein
MNKFAKAFLIAGAGAIALMAWRGFLDFQYAQKTRESAAQQQAYDRLTPEQKRSIDKASEGLALFFERAERLDPGPSYSDNDRMKIVLERMKAETSPPPKPTPNVFDQFDSDPSPVVTDVPGRDDTSDKAFQNFFNRH